MNCLRRAVNRVKRPAAWNHPVRVMRVRLGRRIIRKVDSQLTASLGDLIFIAIVPTLLLAAWLISIYRAARDYDRPSPGARPEHLPERREGG
jgi:hypothetical protein